jgi:hypothetical protein
MPIAGFCFLLQGCLMFGGDPPPAPNVAPIEVVAMRNGCTLNRDSVAAGKHEIAVIMQEGTGRVRIRKDGKAVFDRPIQNQSGVADQSELELQQGEYVVECVVDGDASNAKLVVTP